jgi:uncharacterized protein (DUF924 family)
MNLAGPREILDFWFKETPPERWFTADPDLDAAVRARFEETWRAARAGACESWTSSMEGALALIVLLDQFPRNMFRGGADAFATDAMAGAAAREALARGFDLEAPVGVRSFFYLPFTHSENLSDQEICVRLTRDRLGEHHSSYPYALRHRDAIARFGRFPARNAQLGRPSSQEEIAFLEENPIGF